MAASFALIFAQHRSRTVEGAALSASVRLRRANSRNATRACAIEKPLANSRNAGASPPNRADWTVPDPEADPGTPWPNATQVCSILVTLRPPCCRRKPPWLRSVLRH